MPTAKKNTAAKTTPKATRAPRKSATKKAAAKTAKPVTKKAAKTAKPVAKKTAAAEKGGSKKDLVLGLVARPNGASLAEIMTATSWQAHTVRGFIATLGKKGTAIESFKDEAGVRTYKAA